MKNNSHIHPKHYLPCVFALITIVLGGCALPRIQLYSGEKRPDESICLVRNHPFITSLKLIKKASNECLINTNQPMGKVLFEVEPGEYEVHATAIGKKAVKLGGIYAGVDMVNEAGHTMASTSSTNVFSAIFEAKPNRMIWLLPIPDGSRWSMLPIDKPNNAFNRAP